MPDIVEHVASGEGDRAVQARGRESLISFEFEGLPAFIEPMPFYGDSVRLLHNREVQRLITAVAIGEVDDHDVGSLEDWFPFDLLEVLSLATGVRIGSPYVEFRDAEGQWLERTFINFGHPVFGSKVRATIDGHLHGGIGEILTNYLAVPIATRTYLKAAIHHAVQGGTTSIATEDRLASLFRGFETICVGLETVHGVEGLRSQNLANSLEEENQGLVTQTLKEAVSSIRNAARRAWDDGNAEQAKVLDVIADRVDNAKNREKKFGLQLSALLALLKFHDEVVADRYLLALHPEDPGRRWVHLLSRYRGAVVHEGFLDVYGGTYEEAEVDDLVLHMHDLLLRVILTLIGYSGTYQPPTSMSLDSRTLDWVTPSTDPFSLGYGQHHQR